MSIFSGLRKILELKNWQSYWSLTDWITWAKSQNCISLACYWPSEPHPVSGLFFVVGGLMLHFKIPVARETSEITSQTASLLV